MTKFVDKTITELETIIEVLKNLELNDTKGLSNVDSLLSDLHLSVRHKLNKKVMEDYAVDAFIKNLESKLYKES